MFETALGHLGVHVTVCGHHLQSIDEADVLRRVQRLHEGTWHTLPTSPRDAEQQVKLTTYYAWFAKVSGNGTMVDMQPSERLEVESGL